MNRNEESLKAIFSNSRDEYQKTLNRNKREDDLTLAQGEFANKMDLNDYFMRGFYKWTPDSRNWGCEIDDDVYLVISYSTESSYVNISIVGNEGKIASDTVPFMDYEKVAEAAVALAANNGFDASEEFEDSVILNSRAIKSSTSKFWKLKDDVAEMVGINEATADLSTFCLGEKADLTIDGKPVQKRVYDGPEGLYVRINGTRVCYDDFDELINN